MFVILSACRDRVQLEDRGFVLALGIDLQDNKIVVTACEAGSNDKEVQSIKKGLGNNFTEAFSDANKNTNKKLYIGHMKVVVFGKNLIENQICAEEILKELERADLSRKIIVLAAEKTAADEIKDPRDGQNFGAYVSKYFKNNHIKAKTLEEAIDDAWHGKKIKETITYKLPSKGK
jgi:hypothetical protein